MSSLDEALAEITAEYFMATDPDRVAIQRKLKAQIKAWALEIVPKFSDMPSFSADQMDGFRQACLKMEAKLKES